MRRAWIIALMLGLLWAPFSTFAVEPDEMLADPALEARARVISAGLRCVVCRNQSIDDSNAELARDLRLLLRERLAAGDSDKQAVSYLVDRYGSYILLNPPFQAATLALWLGPLLMLALALAGFAALWRRKSAEAAHPAGLTDDDKALLASVLNDKEFK